jgi:dCTP deaminase
MILSDKDIKQAIKDGRIKVDNFKDYESCIHCASFDLHLGNFFKIFKHSRFPFIDTRDPKGVLGKVVETIEVKDGEAYYVHPGEYVLGVTTEKVGLSDDLVARVEGRSSLGRLGLIIHATAGFVDPGFEGTITLEISNLNSVPIAIYPGMRICQLAFHQMTSPAEIPYNKKVDSKYMNQVLPEESRIVNDREVK